MALDIQSRRRKAKDKETLAKRLAKERKEQREKEREEKEMSRITDNPLAALAVKRPDAPNLKEGVSLDQLVLRPEDKGKANFNASLPEGKLPLKQASGPIDWEAVAESNPGQPKKPVVFVPPGSQKAEADKLLPGGEQGPVAPPEDNTIDQFADAAEDEGERVAERKKRKEEVAAAVESGNEGDITTTGIVDNKEITNSTLPGDQYDPVDFSETGVRVASEDLFDDIDSNLKAQLDDYAAENPIDIEGDQEADPEALAENELFPDRKVKNPNSLPGPEEEGGMMNVGEEEDEPVAEVNPVQAARAKRRSAEFWAQRMKAPVTEVIKVMERAEQDFLAENPNATPEQIKAAVIAELEGDPNLQKAKETHFAQIDANVQRQADQANRARIMGVPRGMVMMLDQINDAETPDDIVKGLITASGVYPQFRPMLQNVITGQVSANALKSQLAAAMMQMQSAEKVALINANASQPTPERTPQAIAEDLKNPTFDSQGVQKASFALMEGGIEGDAKFNQVALSFAPQMRAVAQQALNDESPIQADLNTAREVIQLAIGDELPSAAQVNRLFGGGMTGSQIEKVVHLLYGEDGVRNLHTLGPLRGVAKDWGMGDPATWFGFDDLDNVG